MSTLSTVYTKLGQSSTYSFSDKGQVSVCLYARMEGDTTVAVKLTRVISGVSGVGYSYASAQATLSGSLTHAWSGGASGMVYVGEHTVFEQTFAVTPGLTLSLSAIYDDSYIAALTVSGTCAVPGRAPSVPVVTHVIFDPALQTRHAFVTVYWECENADRYHVRVCRLHVPGDPSQGGETIYEADVYEKGVTFGLSGLPVEAGDDLYFTVQGLNAAGGSDNGFSDYYRLYATVWMYVDGWRRGVPWVRVAGVWHPINRAWYRVHSEWRMMP